MDNISFATFMSILVIGLIIEVSRQVKSLKFDGLLIMRANYAIIYGLCPLCIFFFPDLYKEEINLFGVRSDPSLRLEVATICAVSFLAATVGYRSASLIKPMSPIPYDKREVRRGAVLAGLFAFTAFLIYIYQYGGLFKSIELAAYIRQGFQDEVLETGGSLLFFLNLTPIAFFVLPLAMVLFLKERDYNSLILLFMSFILAVLVSLILSSRGHIVIALIIILFSFMTFNFNGNKKIKISSLIFIICSVIIIDYFIGIGKSLSAALYREDLSVSDVIRDFEYVPLGPIMGYYDDYISSIIVSMSIKGLGYTYFYDSLISPLYLVPSRLFEFNKPESILYFNTYMMIGKWESNIAPGIIAYGNYSLGPIGVIIASLTYGIGLGWLDRSQVVPAKKSYVNTLIVTPCLLYWGVYYFQGNPQLMIGTLATLALFIFIMRLSRNRRAHRSA